MQSFSKIRSIHFEITDKCNANCPMCPRSVMGAEVNPNLSLTEVYLRDFKEWFEPKLIEGLTDFYMCGNYGDPIVAQDTLEVFSYVRSINSKLRLKMFTNGSARNASWWKHLAKIFCGPQDVVHFSIDGLESTNAVYRQNTSWNKILQSIDAFVAAGGQAAWDYLVFEHNKHQVLEAKELAKKLGFCEFNTKYSGRFRSIGGKKFLYEQPVFDSQGKFTHSICPSPESPDKDYKIVKGNFSFRFQSKRKLLELKKWLPNFEAAEFTAPSLKARVECRSKQFDEIFVTAEGFVTPCCWTGYAIRAHDESEDVKQIQGLFHDFGLDGINLHKVKLDKVLSHEIFNLTNKNWKAPGLESGKVLMCQKFCGKYDNPFLREFAETEHY